MNKKLEWVALLMLLAGVLGSCQYVDPQQKSSVVPTLAHSCSCIPSPVVPTLAHLCPSIPSTFKISDLTGIWVASYTGDDVDTLIIKEDGTYKQTYDDPLAGQYYESAWQKWTIEYRNSGYLRLHLKGMRRFGELSIISDREGGGIDPNMFTAIDYCENTDIQMPDEIVLIVTGTEKNVPKNVILRQTRLAGDEWTWSFSAKEVSNKEVSK